MIVPDTSSYDYRFMRTLNEDVKLVSDEYGKYDLDMDNGDYVNVTPCLEYGYHIYVVDRNKNQLNFNEYTLDEKNKAFDLYWKKLYQQYFGKEYTSPK